MAHEVTNGPSPPELVDLLREAEKSVRSRLSLEQVAEEPCIKAWRDAYRAFGAKPSEYRSSVEAMARRVLRGDALPSINALVDIGNVISLRYLVPAGSHAIDVLQGDIEVRVATGHEDFLAFGSTELEHRIRGGDLRRGRRGADPALDLAAGRAHPDPAGLHGRGVQCRRPAPLR